MTDPPVLSGSATNQRRWFAPCAATLLLAALCGCRPETDARPNVLLVTIDALRSDRLHCYGHDRQTSPNIDELASEGIVFENAYAHAPFTPPSHASLLTSLNVPSHGVLGWEEQVTPAVRTMGERFSEAGYRTAAFYNQPGLQASNITRGFQQVRQLFLEDAETTVRLFFEWVDSGEGNFATWLHLWDTHRPYAWRDWRAPYLRPHVQERRDDYTLAYGENLFGEPWLRFIGRDEGWYGLLPEQRSQPTQIGDEVRPPSERDFAYLIDRYDGGVFWADRGIGLLVEGLRERGLLEDTLIVVTSDHGESFMERERRYFAHDPFLFEETLRVPLVMRLPNARRAGTRIDALARGIDVLPTLLEVANLAPDGTEQGQSLLAHANGATSRDAVLFAQTQSRQSRDRAPKPGGWAEEQRAVSDGEHKLIHDVALDTWSYFHLASDPGEEHDRIDDPAVQGHVARLRKLLSELADLPAGDARHSPMSDATEEMLRDTGYLGD